MDSNLSSIVAGTVIIVAVLAGVFALAWHGTLTGAEVFGVITTIIGIAGGILGVHSGIKAGGTAAASGVTAITTPSPMNSKEV
jgi:hypothetical protein